MLRPVRFALFLCVLLAGSATPAWAQLAGTYTLAPSGADFSNIEDATAALRDLGVDGPVVIEIAQATYNERLDLGNVPGASATNTVTFRGIPSGPTLPLITYTPSAGEPNVVHLAKAHWVRLESLRFEITNRNQSYGTVLQIEADDVIVSDCEIRSIDDAAVGVQDAVGIDVGGFNVTIQDTDVNEGDIGIRFRENAGPTSGGQILRNTLDRNVSGGILVEDQAIASGNAVSIRENQVFQNATDVAGWVGIWVRDHTRGAVLARNRVLARSGLGIRIENVTIPSTNYVSVVNNMIFGQLFGIQPGSGIEILNTDRARVQNNTIVMEDQDGTILRVDAASSSIDIRNNILIHQGTGLLVDIESEDSIVAMDYQVYESPNEPTQFRARWMGVVYTDFPAFVATAGRDDNGIVWPVEFEFDSWPHLGGRSDGDGRLIGMPLPSSVPSDFDGDPRSATRPYRGADEAPTPLVDPPPFMSGTYTLGPGDDYATFAEALADLDLRGVGGPVTFEVTGGLFLERIDMVPIPGASAANTVTFVGQVGTPQIKASASGDFNNYVLRMTDVRHVFFERLAFRSQSTGNFADVVDIDGGREITFDECVFIADTPQAVGTLVTISGRVNVSAGNAESVRVLNSTFSGGLRALSAQAIISGAGFEKTGGHEIRGNTITNLRTPTTTAQSTGIGIGSYTAAVVRSNRIEAPLSNDHFVGIDVGSSSAGAPVNDILVEQNVVIAQNGTGISWERYNVDFFNPDVALRLANNTVRMNGNGPTIGIHIRNTGDLISAYNTASVASTDPASAATVVAFTSTALYLSLDLRNNIFDAHLGRALDLQVFSTNSQYVYDYNVLASDGPVLARYEVGSVFAGDCATMACIRAASGSANQDQHSIALRVAFADTSAGDLRLADTMEGLFVMEADGMPEVTVDLDGEPRSEHPYRGADEAEKPIRLPPPGSTSLVINGRLGFRYLGVPADGVTLDELADINLVRGVPGYYPNARAPNIWTSYSAAIGSWVPSLGTGEVLQPGHGFRWQMYDKDQGNPNVSLGYEFPILLSTTRSPNTADVNVTLDTDGARFNFLANPFEQPLDLTGIATWPGGDELSPNAPLWVYDPETRAWIEDPTEALAWTAFRAKAKGPRANGNPRVITIPFTATQFTSAARSSAPAAASPRLAFSLSGTDAAGDALADRALSIRFADDAVAGFDADEDTEKFQVPAEAYALIGARTDGVFTGHDVRPFAEAEIPLAVEARGTASTFTLSWDASALPDGLPVTLVDLETGDETDVRTTSSLTFETAPLAALGEDDVLALTDLADGTDATDRFVLRIGAGMVSAEAPISEVTLSPVAPNPSAGNARVAFALPEAGTVRLTVFDVRGREIAVLADGPLTAGRHEARLDGSLAAGVYLVRLEAGSTVVTRRAVVVR